MEVLPVGHAAAITLFSTRDVEREKYKWVLVVENAREKPEVEIEVTASAVAPASGTFTGTLVPGCDSAKTSVAHATLFAPVT